MPNDFFGRWAAGRDKIRAAAAFFSWDSRSQLAQIAQPIGATAAARLRLVGGDWVGWAVLSRQETPEFLSKPIGNSGVSFFTGGGSIGSGYGRTIKLFINAIKLIV